MADCDLLTVGITGPDTGKIAEAQFFTMTGTLFDDEPPEFMLCDLGYGIELQFKLSTDVSWTTMGPATILKTNDPNPTILDLFFGDTVAWNVQAGWGIAGNAYHLRVQGDDNGLGHIIFSSTMTVNIISPLGTFRHLVGK